jgi:hypothetical protein
MFSLLGGPSLLLDYRVGDIYNHVCLLPKRKEKAAAEFSYYMKTDMNGIRKDTIQFSYRATIDVTRSTAKGFLRNGTPYFLSFTFVCLLSSPKFVSQQQGAHIITYCLISFGSPSVSVCLY